MEHESSPFDVNQKIFDMLELDIDIYMNHSARRLEAEKQLLYFLHQLKTGALEEYGRLYNRVGIFQFTRNMEDAEFFTSDHWEEQIESFHVLMNSICRNDATAMVPLPHIIEPQNDHRDSKYDKMVEELQDDSKNQARASSLEKDYKKMLDLMRLHQGIAHACSWNEIEKDNIVKRKFDFNSINKLKNFFLKHIQSEPEFEAFGRLHLSRLNTLEKDINELRSKSKDDKAESELVEEFIEHSDFCMKNIRCEMDKFLLKCYKMLPKPTLVYLKYNEYLLNRTILSCNSDTKNSPEEKSDCKLSKPDDRSTINERIENVRKERKEVVKKLQSACKKVNEDSLVEAVKMANEATAADDNKVNEDSLVEAVEMANEVTAADDKDASTELSTTSASTNISFGNQKKRKNENDDDPSFTDDSSKAIKLKKKKVPKVKWTHEEDEALIKGLDEFGLSSWSLIKSKYSFELKNRTNVKIKDRHRTLFRQGRIKDYSKE